jgi:hypothetical protein
LLGGLVYLVQGKKKKKRSPKHPYYIYTKLTLYISEIQFMVYSELQDVTVKRIHRKRGWLWLVSILVLSILSTIIFVFIPSHRL